MADDDADDRLLTREAFDASQVANELRFVEDGVELIDYLYNRGKFTDSAAHPRPGIILLDLNMPKKDGREALAEIRKDPQFNGIRVIVDEASLQYVNGSVVDYKESLMGAGFEVNNPNVVAACGCGSSFRVADEEPSCGTTV